MLQPFTQELTLNAGSVLTTNSAYYHWRVMTQPLQDAGNGQLKYQDWSSVDKQLLHGQCTMTDIVDHYFPFMVFDPDRYT